MVNPFSTAEPQLLSSMKLNLEEKLVPEIKGSIPQPWAKRLPSGVGVPVHAYKVGTGDTVCLYLFDINL
jgi:hypothetical protein